MPTSLYEQALLGNPDIPTNQAYPSGNNPLAAPVLQGTAGTTVPAGTTTPVSSAPPAATTPSSGTPGVVTTTDGSTFNLDQHINDLLGQIQGTGFDRSVNLQKMFLEQGLNIDPNVLTPSEQDSLNALVSKVTNTVGLERNYANEVLTNRGLGRSLQLADQFGQYTQKMLQGIADVTVPFVTSAIASKKTEKAHYFDLATQIQDSLSGGMLDEAKTLLSAYDAARSANLSEEQLAFQKDVFSTNSLLQRDQFTEEQKQNMIKNGFSSQQIADAEKQQVFENQMHQAEFTATTDLANKNQALQEQVQLGQLDLNTVKNNHDMGLADRALDLQKELGIDAANLDQEKFDAYAKNLEQEYGLNVNQFELSKFIETGKLSNEILSSQRSLDLQDEKQANDFLVSQQSLDLQDKLGMREMDIKYALGEAQISVDEERNAITKLLGEGQLNIDQQKLNLEIQKYRDQKNAAKGGLLGKIIGAVVKVGASFLNPAGAITNALSTIGLAVVGEAAKPKPPKAAGDVVIPTGM